jgi:hypothetical protein
VSAAAQVTVNVAPPFGLLSASMVPPMRVDDRARDRESYPEALRFRRRRMA